MRYLFLAFFLALLPAAFAQAQPADQNSAIAILQPANPGMFPLMGERNRLSGYWLCSQLIGKTTLGAWSLANNSWLMAPGNTNSANIQFQWQAGGANPRLYIYVDALAPAPAPVINGAGIMKAAGQAFSFSFFAASRQEAEGLSRTTIEIASIFPGLDAFVAALAAGETLEIELATLDMRLAFSCAGFGQAWQIAQAWR